MDFLGQQMFLQKKYQNFGLLVYYSQHSHLHFKKKSLKFISGNIFNEFFQKNGPFYQIAQNRKIGQKKKFEKIWGPSHPMLEKIWQKKML